MVFRLILVFLFLVVFCRVDFVFASALRVNILELAGKTILQVSEKYGDPDSCERVKYGSMCIWNSFGLEVVFISESADWITIKNPKAAFDITLLGSIGLEEQEPSFKNDAVMRWVKMYGFEEISAFPDADKNVDYIYIKVRTE